MSRWIGLAASLYPRSWRQRYGEEFDALLDDLNPGWREFTDVLRGALKMQMTNASAYWKLIGGLAVAGAIVATAVSFSVPRVYESIAVMRLTPQQIPEGASKEEIQEQVASHISQTEQLVLSRTSLEGLITSPALDLYRTERSHDPMEDIVQRMRSQDIRIRMISDGRAFSISFVYPDQKKAQAVVSALVSQFAEQNVARISQEVKPRSGQLSNSLEVLDPPSFPANPIWPNRSSFAAVGLALGLALGSIAAIAIRSPKATLLMAGFALGCCGLAMAISFLMPEIYTSTAVLRFTSPLGAAEKLHQLEQDGLSDAKLAAIITNPAVDLYKEQRASKPMKDTLEAMRHDLSIRPLNQSHAAFSISFTYPDKYKAQAVVRDIASDFFERAAGQYGPGQNMEVLDPPSDPEQPRSPNRWKISFEGFGLGLLLGAVTLYIRQHRSPTLRTA